MTTIELLQRLFTKPTAPFREQFVLEELESLARQKRLPHFRDPSGNLIVGVASAKALETGRRLLLLAHTDHPGFHVKKQKGRNLEAIWYGGAPFESMEKARVRVYDPSLSHLSFTGKIEKFEKGKYKKTGMKLTIQLDENVKLSKGSFGAFDFPGLKIKNKMISTRVADDLAGCVIAFGAVLDQRKKGQVVAVFTRAEEVGFIGCVSFLKNHKFSKDLIAVSLEASRTLPGAEPKKGPVLRLGDRSTLFDHAASQFLFWVAKKLQEENSKSFFFQRRIMDGGSCEATALNLWGLRTTGLAVPLINYHNQGPKGPAPEMISLQDVEMARMICAEAGRKLKFFDKVESELERTIQRGHNKLKRLLGRGKASFLEV